MDKVIGIDMGGTNIKAGLFTMGGDMLDDVKLPTEAHSEKQKILSKIDYCIQKFLSDDVKAIGLGVPEPVDVSTGKIYPPNIQPISGIKIAQEFRRYNLPFVVENDAKCFVLAEQKFGAAKGFNNVIGLTLGTGVGGGIVIDGKLYKGRNGAASEFGHMTIDKDGYLCNCRSYGCLEMYVSGTAIEFRTDRHIHAGDFPTSLKPGAKVLDILEALEQGDKLAIKIMQDTGTYLGIGLSSLINIFNPDIIVLGGSVSQAIKTFEKSMYATMNARAMFPAKNVKVVRYKLDNPGMWGAAYYAIQSIQPNQKFRNHFGFLKIRP